MVTKDYRGTKVVFYRIDEKKIKVMWKARYKENIAFEYVLGEMELKHPITHKQMEVYSTNFMGTADFANAIMSVVNTVSKHSTDKEELAFIKAFTDTRVLDTGEIVNSLMKAN